MWKTTQPLKWTNNILGSQVILTQSKLTILFSQERKIVLSSQHSSTLFYSYKNLKQALKYIQSKLWKRSSN